MVGDVAAEHLDPARRGPDQAERHPDGGGLAGAVRSEEPKDLSADDFEVEVLHRGAGAVRLGQIVRRQDGPPHHLSSTADGRNMTIRPSPISGTPPAGRGSSRPIQACVMNARPTASPNVTPRVSITPAQIAAAMAVLNQKVR